MRRIGLHCVYRVTQETKSRIKLNEMERKKLRKMMRNILSKINVCTVHTYTYTANGTFDLKLKRSRAEFFIYFN